MSEGLPVLPRRQSLPLASAGEPAASWHGWMPVEPGLLAAAAPEPDTPQGAYRREDVPAPTPERLLPDPVSQTESVVELLAPAGGLEAGYAAFQYGADAVYLGLKKFSARAEAENFTLAELETLLTYAHSLTPRRRVFVTLNTLIREDELPELIETVVDLFDLGVDALIVQDLGVYHLVRRHFPDLELHASTQLAVHNAAGARTLRQLGFRRVVLARELTMEEVDGITASAGIETEVFIHGALCYSYSGLCLFSSQTLGRSGNRGKCAYSCRDEYTVAGAPLTLRDGASVQRDPRRGFPFSMKDLALPDHLPALRAAGVACFKIEGRKKSPLYVATTTDFYRRLLDGTLTPEHRPPVEADLQTVFSRPWTHLFLDSHRDKEVADRDTVGHRGTPIGVVESVRGGNEPRLAFRTNRPLERHDGLQVDLPGHLGKPFGFAVDRLWLARRGQRREEVVQAPAGAWVEVSLPRDHPPLPPGAPVYCSSSQAVKQRYRTAVPKSDALRRRRPIAIELRLRPDGLEAIARLTNVPAAERLEVHALATERLTAARDSAAIEAAARAAFERLGNTAYVLSEFQLVNPDNLFVAVSRLNALRRELVEQLDLAVAARRSSRSAELVRRELASSAPAVAAKSSFAWSLKVDRLDMLEALADSDLEQLDEIVIDIARDSLGDLTAALDAWGTRVGREKLRLALPPLTRKWEEYGLVQKIDRLRGRGWGKWEAANLSAWSYLGIDVAPSGPVSTPGLDLATDWSVYVLNRLAAREVQRLGATRFALSPEDGLANLRTLLREFAHQAVVIVYQDTPQFLAESCAYANLIGGCPGKANCRFESMEMVSSHGERVTALDYHCRTIVLNDGPFCLASRLRDLAAAGAQRLRADFIYRPYTPELVRDRWRAVRAGRPVPGGHSANFDRGLL